MKIPFHLVRINYREEEPYEVIFPFGEVFYTVRWEDAPDRFKELYVVWLKLSGVNIPEYLLPYVRDIVDVTNTEIEFDPAKCTEVPVDYPVGG